MRLFRTITHENVSTAQAPALVSRRALFKYLGAATTTTALAAGSQALLPSLASADAANWLTYTPEGKASGVSVVLVHGAFADASSWRKVIPLLQKAGHNVLAVQIPLTSLTDDIAVTRGALASISGPIVLAGHSYGGAVISGAATGVSNVVGLVYASAYAPAQGENILSLNALFPPTEVNKYLRPSYVKGAYWIDPAAFPTVFVQDIPLDEARTLAVVQKPIAGPCFVQKAGPAAWKTIRSWYIVSENDRTINPNLERFLARRMGATTYAIPSSHASPVSHPNDVARVILAAVQHKVKA